MRIVNIIIALNAFAFLDLATADVLDILKMFKPDTSLKNVLNEKDSTGQTLQNVVNNYYGKYVIYKGERAQFRLMDRSRRIKAVELNKPSLSINRNRMLTDADRLNGIDGVFFVHFTASSKRVTQFGNAVYGDWRPVGMSLLELNIQVKRKNGRWDIKRMHNLYTLVPSAGGAGNSIRRTTSNGLPSGMSRIKK